MPETSRYETMKDSGVEIIGDIPSHWRLSRLRFLCSILTGNQDTQDAQENGKYPFFVRSPIIERSDNYTFDGEGILMAGDGVGAGKVFHHAYGKYAIHQRVYCFHSFTSIYPRFLYYYLSSLFSTEIDKGSAKSTVASVRLPMLLNFNVCIPSKDEQTAIAEYLDAESAKIDEIIAEAKASIEDYKAWKFAIITKAVTGNLDVSIEKKETGISWLGSIPRHWQLVKLSELCARPITYGIVKLGDADDDDGVKVLRCSDVRSGYIDPDNIRTVTKKLSNEYKRTILEGGEIVINVRGTLGGCAIVPDEFAGYNIAREVAVVPICYANSRYIMYCLLSHVFSSYQEYSLRGSIYIGLNINVFVK